MKENSRKPRMPKPHSPVHPNVPALEWVSDVSGRAARTTAIGCRRVLIENHTGILEFTDERVHLSTPSGDMRVFGKELTLMEVRPNALMVHGSIHRVDLPAEEDHS